MHFKQLGDTFKFLGNSHHGKMIEDLLKQLITIFTKSTNSVEKAFGSPYFKSLEEIGDVYEIRQRKPLVIMDRPYQCGIAVYQLAKLRMLECYYDFIHQYFDRQDFELLLMDIASLHCLAWREYW